MMYTVNDTNTTDDEMLQYKSGSTQRDNNSLTDDIIKKRLTQ